MIYNDINAISYEAYCYCPKLYKKVDNAVKYYILMKNRIDKERFETQPSHSKITITDASDNIAQSYFRDWLWFDELYQGYGVVNKNCSENDLEKIIIEE